MTRIFLAALIAMLALSGCSAENHGNPEPGPAAAGGGDKPQIAYGYTYRFTLPGAAVMQAQDRHIALCDHLGPARCRLEEMHRGTSEASASGSIRLAVASGDARRFGQDLIAPVRALRGELKSRDFEAENVLKEIDEAKAKTVEKNVVANRAALADVRDRVAMSSIRIYYEGSSGFAEQTGSALGAAGETLTASIAVMIYFVAATLPWVVVFGAVFLAIRVIMRRVRRRFPRPMA